MAIPKSLTNAKKKFTNHINNTALTMIMVQHQEAHQMVWQAKRCVTKIQSKAVEVALWAVFSGALP